jgi:hypothetical protein
VRTSRKVAVVGGIVVVAGVAVALAAGGAYVALGDPLEAGSSWVRGASRDIGIVYEGVPQYQVSFAADGDFRWGVEVRNPLAVPVTIRGLRPTLSELAPLVVHEELRLTGSGAASLEPADLRPFEPVELGPGGRVFLVVREQFAACEPAHASWAPGSGVVRDTLPLDVSVLGMTRSTDVRLPFATLYSAPPGACAPA